MTNTNPAPRPIVIAHRGASGYLPEHTPAAKALAYGQGADYLEQDVVLTADGVPIVLHDVHLDTVTDVADRFPTRGRNDGRFYAADFTLEEIRTLTVHERIDLRTGQTVYPNRFPLGHSRFSVPTLREELELVVGLNAATGRDVGVYPEIKQPAWHRDQGLDPTPVVLSTLADYGYDRADSRVFVQCFDPAELRRIRDELGSPLPLVQLIGENDWQGAAGDYDAMRTPAGLRQIAEYAAGIGPRWQHTMEFDSAAVRFVKTGLVDAAHAAGLLVHPYTFRYDELPNPSIGYEQLVGFCVQEAGVDGLFTDFPDRTLRILNELPRC